MIMATMVVLGTDQHADLIRTAVSAGLVETNRTMPDWPRQLTKVAVRPRSAPVCRIFLQFSRVLPGGLCSNTQHTRIFLSHVDPDPTSHAGRPGFPIGEELFQR